MGVVPMELLGVRLEVQANTPIVLLQEAEGRRRVLPIYIGNNEAAAIAYALERVVPPRPLTHDLFRNVLEELGAALERVVVTELVEHTFYDAHAVAAARTAGGFLQYGVEPRHLRLYRNAADREAGLIEQVIMPWVKQRNPQSRAHAHTTLEALARLGGELREAMLRQTLRPYSDG